MEQITVEKAISIVRALLGFEEMTTGMAWLVRRLDRPPETYFLVELRSRNSAVAIATVDTHTGKVGEYARLPGVGPHITIDEERAKELAANAENSQAEMVWLPCSASKSPLYPLWEVRTASLTCYVDQNGRILDRLEEGKIGG